MVLGMHSWEDDEPSDECKCRCNHYSDYENRLLHEIEDVKKELEEYKKKNAALVIEFMKLLDRNAQMQQLLHDIFEKNDSDNKP